MWASKQILGMLLAMFVCLASGCALWRSRGDEAEIEKQFTGDEERDHLPRLVGEYARPWGQHFMSVEAVALCRGLANTGSDPAPSSQRRVLIAEMLRREVRRPEEVLADPRNAMVVVRAFLPPGARKGDRVDVEVRSPSRSETTSLKGGWLMDTRLQEMAVLEGQIHTGNVGVLAQGNVLVDAVTVGESDPVSLLRGRVLGGGIVAKNRSLGLLINRDKKSVSLSMRITEAINNRFHVFADGSKRGVATAKNDEYIDLALNTTYRENITRYLRVVREIPLRQTPAARREWIKQLETELLIRETSSLAALRLEAIGNDAIPSLRQGLKSDDPEVRLYAAEALAYLNVADAAKPLAEAAKSESAFRWHALTALSVMSPLSAHDALRGLLDEPSAETRYGAFRSLRTMNPADPLIKGVMLGEAFAWHEIASAGPPLLHISRTRRAEIVAFGGPQRLERGFVSLNAGPQIMIQPSSDSALRVTRYGLDGASETREIPNNIADLLRTVVELDADYGDVISMLMEAGKRRVLSARLVFDAIPKSGRGYTRRDRASRQSRSEGDDPSDPDSTDRSSSAAAAEESLDLPGAYEEPGEPAEADGEYGWGDVPQGVDTGAMELEPPANAADAGSAWDRSDERDAPEAELLPPVEPATDTGGANKDSADGKSAREARRNTDRSSRDERTADRAAASDRASKSTESAKSSQSKRLDKTGRNTASTGGRKGASVPPTAYAEPSARDREVADRHSLLDE